MNIIIYINIRTFMNKKSYKLIENKDSLITDNSGGGLTLNKRRQTPRYYKKTLSNKPLIKLSRFTPTHVPRLLSKKQQTLLNKIEKQKLEKKIFYRNLAINDINYINFLINDCIDTINDFNKDTVMMQEMIGGSPHANAITFSRLTTTTINREKLLALDNLHDFAVNNNRGGLKREYFKNMDDVLNNDDIKISTFEDNLFNKYNNEYKTKYNLFFIVDNDLQNFLDNKIQLLIDGNIFIDTTPHLVSTILDDTKKRNTIASYFDPSSTTKIKIIDDPGNLSMQYFNEAINILKEIYEDLKNIEIKLISYDLDIPEYTFEIKKGSITNKYSFLVGQNGIFTVENIKNSLTDNTYNFSPIDMSRTSIKFTKIEINSILLLMKALGDFSQIHLSFKLNDNPNLLTTVDKFLFTTVLYLNLNLNINNYNKNLYLLIGTGNTVSDADDTDRKKTGDKILIYNNKTFFYKKSLSLLLYEKYKGKLITLKLKYKPNSSNNYPLLIGLNINELNIYLYTLNNHSDYEVILNDTNIDNYISIYNDISTILDYVDTIFNDKNIYEKKLQEFDVNFKKLTDQLTTSIIRTATYPTLNKNRKDISTINITYNELIKQLTNIKDNINTYITNIKIYSKYGKLSKSATRTPVIDDTSSNDFNIIIRELKIIQDKYEIYITTLHNKISEFNTSLDDIIKQTQQDFKKTQEEGRPSKRSRPNNSATGGKKLNKIEKKIIEYKNKTLSNYFIKKIKKYLKDDSIDVYKLGIKKIKDILKNM